MLPFDSRNMAGPGWRSRDSGEVDLLVSEVLLWENNKPEGSGGACRCGRDVGRGRGGGVVPGRRKTEEYGGGGVRLRRAFSTAWGHETEREERGKREEIEGYI